MHYTTTTDEIELTAIPYVDFDTSMQKEKYTDLLKDGQLQIYNFFKYHYESCNPRIIPFHKEALIPNIIHFIWVGSEFPEKYVPIIQSWIDKNPNCIVKIWIDSGIPATYDFSLKVIFVDINSFEFENRDLFNQERNYGAKSDILRVAILEKEGGIYADIDQECLRSFDSIRHTCHFAIGIQPLDTNFVQLGIGLIASTPHHPILLHAIKKLQESKNEKQIIVRTGPIFFTRCYLSCCGKTGLKDIAFPASYFYPCGYTQRGESIEKWNKREAYAVHHWAGSWLAKEAHVPGTFNE